MTSRVAASPLERLTIGHYMMRRWSLEDDVRELERLGFRSISLASTKLDAYGVERAIALSHDTYCSATIMLAKTAEITTSFDLIET